MLCLLLGAPQLLYAQRASYTSSEAGLPAIQAFSRNDYGAHSQNWAILKDQRGVMYFGNGAGVLEYDGVSWRLIRLPHRGAAFSLALGAQGRIYVGARNEFGYLAPDASGHLQYVSLVPHLAPEHQEYDGTAFTPFQTDPALQVYQATSLADGGWALEMRQDGLARINRQGRLQYILNKATGLPNQRVLYLYRDDQRGLWVALDAGLARVEAPSPLSLYQDALGIDGMPRDFTRHQRCLYVATSEGMRASALALTAGGLKVFEPVQGAVDAQSWVLLSLEGTLLGATNMGIHRIEGNQTTLISDFSRPARFFYPSPYDPHLVYVGGREGLGLLSKRGGQWQFAERVSGVPREIRYIAEEAPRLLWLSTADNRLHRVQLSEDAANGEAGILVSNRFDAGIHPGIKIPYLV